ncbi:MAG: iron-sulfur cluster-binding protein [Verrucomicrobiales bacterium]|jgi:L-lactate dehydrogenase complex protein LldF|nr:iron-sulfur cluster-binding protein [Verrucomicrobiales bacterium]
MNTNKHEFAVPHFGQPIDRFVATVSDEVYAAVHSASAIKSDKRAQLLAADYADPLRLRELAGQIKRHTLDHLDQYLPQAVASLERNGARVHFAADDDEARRIIGDLLQQRGAKTVVKSKSMATEEIHLNDYLAARGIESVETDLGEFILQIDGDTPSHIVTPVVHKNRRQIAHSFERHGLGAYNDEPETITRRARRFMRDRFLRADAGLTGANFLVAESGRLVLVTNEGNSRFSLSAPRLHIALVGIEKIVPADRDLGVFLNLLVRSATGQQFTAYTEFISGPRAAGRPSGAEELHVVLLDNGRADILGTEYREILRCIRCGACMNICPVYRQASGHAYRAVYPGPVGAVLTPLLAGENFARFADLPKACSVCGACGDACPVNIALPDLLLRLRDRAKREGAALSARGTPPLGGFAAVATRPPLWRAALTLSRLANRLPLDWLPVPPLSSWTRRRTLPEFRGGAFRQWFKQRGKQ